MNIPEQLRGFAERDFSHYLALDETRSRSRALVKTRAGSVVADTQFEVDIFVPSKTAENFSRISRELPQGRGVLTRRFA